MKKVPEELLSPYKPELSEQGVYDTWEKSGYFSPENLPVSQESPRDTSYTIIAPPPNVTGVLHLGHATMLAIQDALIRYKRMKGYRTLWLPGTDHAAIATQSVVEKKISKEEGKSRHDIGREEMMRRINEFAMESQQTIISQFRSMGASLDWTRLAFTLDDKRNLAVRTMFSKMYKDGLIYQGHRIVNWDPKGQTTISDDEIVYVEEKTKLYYFKYGPFVISTSRPETKFGDKYVVMHPDDKRYAEFYHGQKMNVEWIHGEIEATVIKDSCIDPNFGTGVMTITPWHSVADFEIAGRHGLNYEQIIDKYGKMLPVCGDFAGLKIKDAREQIVLKLQEKGLVEKIDEYTHNIGTAERTGGIIEPQIMKQWFVAVNKEFAHVSGTTTLKKLMHEAVSQGEIKIIPERFDKIYHHWITNLHDWCISRQIWYGHRVPVWYKDEEIFCGINAPIGEGWAQDEDTLDTWFSSAMWTFSTLGWPEETEDMKNFHPTDLMETGYDILFFWVARMIMMSKYALNVSPFKNVYLHGLVRDGKGQKMSKSLGNALDPRDMCSKYGTDALRMALIVGTGPGNDTKLAEDKIKAYKLFSNKIWNATRFVLDRTEDFEGDVSIDILSGEHLAHYKQWRDVFESMEKDIEEFRLGIVTEKIYSQFWNVFADSVIEEMKITIAAGGEDKRSAQALLLLMLREQIIVMHPFMPFITETIWKHIKRDDEPMLIVMDWLK